MRNFGIAVLAVVVVLVVLAALGVSGGGGIFRQQHTVNIINGVITVGPRRNYDHYAFIVPAGASGARIQGSFIASGGSGNGVEVMVLDSTNYAYWVGGHIANTYYNSGQVTTGTISVSLPAGEEYYLVYTNQIYGLSSTNVTTSVNLTYTTSTWP